jgi:hypothetical protein
MKDALTDPEFQETIKNTVALYTGPNTVSQISSFAIAIGLAFLGQYLATKKKESPTARFVAGILGTSGDTINKDDILRRLKDKNYSDTVRKKILDIIQTSSIDEFARSANLSLSETLETYMQIKEYVIDSEVIGMIPKLEKERPLSLMKLKS